MYLTAKPPIPPQPPAIYLETTTTHGSATQLGFNLLLDRSGKLLFKKKAVTKKDITVNPRVAWLLKV